VREMFGCEPPISESHERASLSEQADGTAVPTEMSCLINEMYLLAPIRRGSPSKHSGQQSTNTEAEAKGRS
jgi:hypothetical protein